MTQQSTDVTLEPCPCPYCGVEAKEFDGDYCFIHKDDCFLARGSQTQWLTSKNVIVRWNTRTTLSKPVGIACERVHNAWMQPDLFIEQLTRATGE